MKRLLLTIGVVTLFTACDGGSDTDNLDPKDGAIISYDLLKAPKPSSEVLQYATGEQLLQLLSNGVRRDVHNTRDFIALGEPNFAFESSVSPAAESASDASADNSSRSFSGTNTQVFGVDEADHVKYDGEYLYVHAWPRWVDGESTGDSIKILATDPETATASPVAEIPFSDSSYSALELYLLNDEPAEGAPVNAPADALVSLSSSGFIGFCGVGIADWGWYNTHYSSAVKIHDLENPAEPELTWELELDGMLHNSRKIGDMLYLVTSYLPQLSVLKDTADGGAPALLDHSGNDLTDLTEDALSDLSIADLLPGYRINGGERQLLTTGDECLASADLDEYQGYRSLHHIVAIDLRKQVVAKSVCLSTPVENIYSSTDALYLVATEYGNNWRESYSVMHKFSLADNTVDYVATGSVPGNLGWSSPSFRMDEYQDHMRILTSSMSDDGEREHRLWVLTENTEAKTLDLVSMLPAEDSDQAIGKPGEDVYAVRFWEDRAYVVTFQQTDPLYILDLSNPAAPQIAGELELPGFSTYLHPIDDDYVFGFGREATEQGIQLGLKAALFDVSDPANPTIAGEVTMGGNWSWSDALYDHKSLSFLRHSDDELRITLPVTLGGGGVLDGGGELSFSPSENTRMLVLMNVSGLTQDQASLGLQGAMVVDSATDQLWSSYSAFGRGILHGDAVYYVEEPSVWGAFWSDPDTVLGPFNGEQ